MDSDPDPKKEMHNNQLKIIKNKLPVFDNYDIEKTLILHLL
jgi:hypothetical protein